MTTIKKDTLILNSGRQIQLQGNTISIGATLELGNGFNSGVFSINKDWDKTSELIPVANPYNLSASDILEIADYYMGQWLRLKENIRMYGTQNPFIFIKG